jgi:hypothetical protein
MRVWLTAAVISLSALVVSGCGEQPKVKIISVEMVSNDTGSPDFRRMVKICFDQPLSGDYHHEIFFESKDGFSMKGESLLKAAVSDPQNPCILRNLNNYVTRSSPPRARDLIDRYLVKGNVSSVKISVWGNESGEKGLKMDSKTFNNL